MQPAKIILFQNRFQIIDPPELLGLTLTILRDDTLPDDSKKYYLEQCWNNWCVTCAVSGEQIPLGQLRYWDADTQLVYCRPELVPQPKRN